ncbi:MAG: hypothetical protein INQ03_23105 [Candidatus Heimdallarchaeota archaeon]|nr:hypothetical protein [Candidatus Heimdallarchaeota archaeon]
MDLNWTIESILVFASLPPLIYTIFVVGRIYFSNKITFLSVFFTAWVMLALYWIVLGFSYLFYNEQLFKYAGLLILPIYVMIPIAFDLMVDDKISTSRFAILMMLIGILLYDLFLHDQTAENIYQNGDKSFIVTGNYRIILAIVAIYAGGVFVFNSYRIMKQSPQTLRGYAQINFIGSLLFAVIPALIFALEINNYIPGIDIATSVIGLVVSAWALNKRPQLFYVLSFSTYKLSVIQSDSGISLFSYNWNDGLFVDDLLFSSIIEGIKGFTDEVLNAGLLESFNLQKGKLMLTHTDDQQYYFVLFASRESVMLRNALELFKKDFIDTYKPSKLDTKTVVDIVQYERADKLVKKAFSFISF